AYLLAICAGAAFGFANGFLVTAGRIPSFIATLGTLSIGRTAIYLLTGGWPVSGLLAPFVFSGDMRNNGPIIVMVVLTIAGIIVLTKTGFGRRVYAIGGNETAARLSGVNVNRTKLAVYIITGALCALAGVLNAAVLGVGDPEGGKGYELDVIAASVIGGTSLAGGRGSIFGAFLGAAIMGVIRNGLVLMDVRSDRHPGVIGLVIIVAVLFDTWRRRSKGAFQE
ncbi:MAG: ABC transporter permease, partial [Armatimonadota bacterium]